LSRIQWRRALAGLELLADTPHHRLAIFHCHREACRHPRIRAGDIRVPRRPNDRVTALENETIAGMRGRGRIVERIAERDRTARGHVKEPRAELLVAAIEHLVEQKPDALGRIGRAQNEDVDLVFDHTAAVARRLVEIDDAGVLRRLGSNSPLATPLDPLIGATPRRRHGPEQTARAPPIGVR
jgi:hypothetical protein